MGKQTQLFLLLITLLGGVLREGPTGASGNVATYVDKCEKSMDSFWDDGLLKCRHCSDVCKFKDYKKLCFDKCSDYLRMQRILEMIQASQDAVEAKISIISQSPTDKMTSFQILSITFYVLASLVLSVLTILSVLQFRKSYGVCCYNPNKGKKRDPERPNRNRQFSEKLSAEYESFSDLAEHKKLLKKEFETAALVPDPFRTDPPVSTQIVSGIGSQSASDNLPSHDSAPVNTTGFKSLKEVRREAQSDMAAAKLNPQPQSHEPAEGGTRPTGSLRRNASRDQSLSTKAPYVMGTLPPPSLTYLNSRPSPTMTSRQSSNTRSMGPSSELPPSVQTRDTRHEHSFSLDGVSIPYGNVVPNGSGVLMSDSYDEGVLTNNMVPPAPGAGATDTRPFLTAPPVAVGAVEHDSPTGPIPDADPVSVVDATYPPVSVGAVEHDSPTGPVPDAGPVSVEDATDPPVSVLGHDSRVQQPADDATCGAYSDFDDDTGMHTFLNGPQLPEQLEAIFDACPLYELCSFDANDRLVVYVLRDHLDEAKRQLEPQIKQYWKKGFQILPEP